MHIFKINQEEQEGRMEQQFSELVGQTSEGLVPLRSAHRFSPEQTSQVDPETYLFYSFSLRYTMTVVAKEK